MSCTKVRREVQGNQLRRELEAMGVSVQAGSMQSLAEEAPAAYKDINDVVGAVVVGRHRKKSRKVGAGGGDEGVKRIMNYEC
jgi:tRNA-splicing ligase RtcB